MSVSVGNGGDPATEASPLAFRRDEYAGDYLCCFSVSASVQSEITTVHGVNDRFWMMSWAQRKNNG